MTSVRIFDNVHEDGDIMARTPEHWAAVLGMTRTSPYPSFHLPAATKVRPLAGIAAVPFPGRLALLCCQQLVSPAISGLEDLGRQVLTSLYLKHGMASPVARAACGSTLDITLPTLGSQSATDRSASTTWGVPHNSI